MKKYLMLIAIVVSATALLYGAWDNDLPGDNQVWNNAAGSIRDNFDALEVELGIDLAEAHPYFQGSAPSKKPDGSTALDEDDHGRLWIDSDDNNIYILTDYSVPTWTASSSADSVSASDATFTLTNTDEEDTDGGRQGRFIAKGEQASGAASTLGYLDFSHDGTGDDQKGKFAIVLNDGDDDNAPSKTAITYLSTGLIDADNSLSVLDEDDMVSDSASVVATQQSIKAYVDAQGVVQIVNSQTGAVATVSTLMINDDSIPQNTEGDQYMTLAITPTSATNALVINVLINCAANSGTTLIGALFQDTTANALAAGWTRMFSGDEPEHINITYYMLAGTTSETTFKVRAGGTTGTFTFNGTGAARKLGGILMSSITIMEIEL